MMMPAARYGLAAPSAGFSSKLAPVARRVHSPRDSRSAASRLSMPQVVNAPDQWPGCSALVARTLGAKMAQHLVQPVEHARRGGRALARDPAMELAAGEQVLVAGHTLQWMWQPLPSASEAAMAGANDTS